MKIIKLIKPKKSILFIQKNLFSSNEQIKSSLSGNSNFNFANISIDNSEMQKNEVFLDNYLMNFRNKDIKLDCDQLKNILVLNKSQFNPSLEKEVEDILYLNAKELCKFSLNQLCEILALASSINFYSSNKEELILIENIIIEKLVTTKYSSELNNSLILLVEALITIQYSNLDIFENLFTKVIFLIKSNFHTFEEVDKLKLGSLIIFFNSNNLAVNFKRHLNELNSKSDIVKNPFSSDDKIYNKELYELLLMYTSHVHSCKNSDLYPILLQMLPKIVFDKCLLGKYSKTELYEIMNKNSELISNYIKNLGNNINNQQIESILLSNSSNYLFSNESLIKKNLEKAVIYSAGINNEVILETIFFSLREIKDLNSKDINYLKALINRINNSSITGTFNKSKSLTGIVYRKQIQEIDSALYDLSSSLKQTDNKLDEKIKNFIGRFIIFYPFSGVDYENEVKMIYNNWLRI